MSGSSSSESMVCEYQGYVFAIPLDVLEAHRVEAEKRNEAEGYLNEDVVNAGDTPLQIPAEVPVYSFSPEEFATYCVSGTERDSYAEKVANAQGDVQGYGYGKSYSCWCPPVVTSYCPPVMVQQTTVIYQQPPIVYQQPQVVICQQWGGYQQPVNLGGYCTGYRIS